MEKKYSNNKNTVESKPLGKAMKMDSFSSDKKSVRSMRRGRPATGDSQEEILPESGRASSERDVGKSFVLVQRDVVWIHPHHPSMAHTHTNRALNVLNRQSHTTKSSDHIIPTNNIEKTIMTINKNNHRHPGQ